MLGLGVLVVFVVGACWLFGALIGGLFKFAFGLIGALFGSLFGLFAFGLIGLLVLPVVLLALLPLLMPALFVGALVWLVVHASRAPAAPPGPAQGEARIG